MGVRKMTEKEKLETQIRLFELQLNELRATHKNKRPSNYDEQLYKIAKHIKSLKTKLSGV